jgi:hypothetical protein
MNLETFASKYRLKARRNLDDDGASTIEGHQGHIYEYSDSELAVMFLPGEWCPKTWGNFRRKAEALGMAVRQDGDSEGALSFDPSNKEQAKLAIQIAAVRPKRQLAPEHRAKLLAVGFQKRSTHTLEGAYSV